MKRVRIFTALFAVLLFGWTAVWGAPAEKQYAGSESRPPLGWNSYDSYGTHINEELALRNLDAFVARLKPYGYEYFVLDAGWYRDFDLKPGEAWPTEGDECHLSYDEYGRLVPSRKLFPEGFGELVRRAHGQNLKFGLHLMRGIPREVVEKNLPIKGTRYFARDIADTTDVCDWSSLCYGVDMDKPGAQAYYDSVVELLAQWGVDFIKYDDIVHKPREIHAVADAIAHSGRDIFLSLSPGDDIDPKNLEAFRRADMIRVTRDIWDLREDIQIGFERWEALLPYAGQGFWLDLDMLPLGHIRINYPLTHNNLNPGRGYERMDYFSYAQKKTFVTQRALAASPLFMGGSLLSTPEPVFELITDRSMLECVKNGVVGRLVKRISDYSQAVDVWNTPHRKNPGEGWLGIFNRKEFTDLVKLDKTDLGLDENSCYELYDIWNKRWIQDGKSFVFELAPDDVVFIKYHECQME